MILEKLRPFLENSKQFSCARGEIIYYEGDLPEKLYFIEEGLVGLFNNSLNGKETFLRVFGKGDIFGHRSFLEDGPYHASSMALNKTSLTTISKDECQLLCGKQPSFLLEIAKILSKELKSAELRIAGLQDKSANARIAESLIFLKLAHPDYTWTRKEIAEYSGSTFETVARVMTILSKSKLIKKQGRDFLILDVKKLRTYFD